MAEFHNPCGGKRWRTLPSGYIEIEGEGTPRYPKGSSSMRYLEQSWRNWKPLFIAASKSTGVPARWLASISAIETGLWSNDPERQRTISSHVGAVGIMQIMPSTGALYGVKRDQLFDPAINIMTGAKVIRERMTKGYDLPSICAFYNSGSLCSPGRNEWNLRADSNYPRHVILWNNAMLADGMEREPFGTGPILGIAVGLLGVAAALYVYDPKLVTELVR